MPLKHFIYGTYCKIPVVILDVAVFLCEGGVATVSLMRIKEKVCLNNPVTQY